jgi:hypothetical protein
MKGLTSGVSIRYYSYQFGALPTQFSTSPSSDPNHWSFYATLNPAPTISSVSLSNNSLTVGAPAGTVIGAISVTMSSGSFTGSLALSGANASSFKIVGSNLETNGVLPAGSYNINIVATQRGAADSPFTQAETITAVSQSISSVSLSNASFVGGSPSGTVVGTINVTMSPSSRAFSGSLSLSTTKGGCTATNGANNSSFAISGNKLITNGTVAPGTYAVCILATEASASNSPVGQAKKLTANSTKITIGETNQLAGGVIGDRNLLFAQNTALSQTATIESLSIYAAAGTGNLILGIYADNGSGAPGALQAQTASFSAAAGWNTANITAPVSLQPGTYWLAWLTDSNVLSVPGVTTGTDAYYPFSFGSLPPTFSGTATIETAHRSLYATLNTGAVSEAISSVSLSKSSFVGGSPSGTVVGTINVAVSPSSPPFSGSLSLSTTQGGCTATNGANNSSFAISGNNLVTNGTIAPGSYAVCILATQAGATNSPFGQAKTVTASQNDPSITNVALSCGACSFASTSLTGNIGTLSSTPPTGVSFSLSTAAGAGGTPCLGTNGRDNGLFTISGTSLNVGAIPLTPTGGGGGNGVYDVCVAAAGATYGNSPYDQPFTVTVTTPIAQTISSIALSNTSTTTGLTSGTPVGTLSASLSPPSPTFTYSGTNLHLSTSGADSGGVCNSTNGAGNGSFQIINGDTLATIGTLTSGSKSICVAASEAGVSAKGQTFTISVGNLIQATSFCASNGGGTGSSSSPWHAACLQAAINAAANGDTVFLAAGNWVLNTITDAAGVTINKPITVVGAGSGNTFDVYGHINNGSGTTPCPTSLSTVTCIYPRGTSFQYGNNPPNGSTPSRGTIKVGLDLGGGNCNNNTFAHIAFDSSLVSPGGDDEGLLNIERCPGPITLTDIRFYAFDGKRPVFQGSASGTVLTVNASPAVVGIISVGTELYVNGADSGAHIVSYGTGTGKAGTYNLSGTVTSGTTNMQTDGNYETQPYIQVSSNILIENSLFGIAIVDGSYSGTEILETVGTTNETLKNVLLWQGFYAPTNNQNNIMTGSVTQTDANDHLAAGVLYTGPTGCHLNPGNGGASGCAAAMPSPGGTRHVTFSNNYLTTGSLMPNSLGGAVNDPSTNGNVSDFNLTGNWVVGTTASIAACTWVDSAAENFCNGDTGPSMNAAGDPTTCALSHDDSNLFNITNNSILGSSVAKIDGQGFGTMNCFVTGGQVAVPIDIFGLNAQKNYFSSPSNQFTTNANTISPVQTNNFCTPAAGTVTGCATSGFTTPPTGSFTPGSLFVDPTQSGNVVKFTSTGFTAQYGAVKWLASTSSTTPTSSGQTGTGCNGAACNWAFVPPASLAGVTHGSTVYMWVMDSAGNIGAATPQTIP